MIVGMFGLLIGLSNVSSFIKYSKLFLPLTSFLFLIFSFTKGAINQIGAAKGKVAINE